MADAGFNVLRAGDAGGSDRQAVNAGLIAAQGSQGLGAQYSLDDPTAMPGTWYYWLEEIDMQGRRTLYGPLPLVVSSPTAVTLHGVSLAGAPPLSAVGWLLFGLLLAFTAVVRMRRP